MTSRPRGERKTPGSRQRAIAAGNGDPYGYAHQVRRRFLLAILAGQGGALCPICGKLMTVAMRLHLHHSNPAYKLAGLPGDQLVHAGCNLRDGGKDGAAITNCNQPAKRQPVRIVPPLPAEHRPGCRCAGRSSRCW